MRWHSRYEESSDNEGEEGVIRVAPVVDVVVIEIAVKMTMRLVECTTRVTLVVDIDMV